MSAPACHRRWPLPGGAWLLSASACHRRWPRWHLLPTCRRPCLLLCTPLHMLSTAACPQLLVLLVLVVVLLLLVLLMLLMLLVLLALLLLAVELAPVVFQQVQQGQDLRCHVAKHNGQRQEEGPHAAAAGGKLGRGPCGGCGRAKRETQPLLH